MDKLQQISKTVRNKLDKYPALQELEVSSFKFKRACMKNDVWRPPRSHAPSRVMLLQRLAACVLPFLSLCTLSEHVEQRFDQALATTAALFVFAQVRTSQVLFSRHTSLTRVFLLRILAGQGEGP